MEPAEFKWVLGHMTTRAVLVSTLITIALAGCDWPFRSDYRDVLSSASDVTAPDTVAVGASFEVTFLTAGSNGCWRKGGDRVTSPSRLQFGIWPHDREYVGPNACTDNEPVFHHAVQLTASTPGTVSITVFTRMRSSAGRDSVGTIQASVYAR